MNPRGSAAEMPRSASLGSHANVGGTAGLETKTFSSRREGIAGLLRAARRRQWIKNLACFAGLIFSGRLFQPAAVAQSCVAFMGFCLASSGIYLLNDVCD